MDIRVCLVVVVVYGKLGKFEVYYKIFKIFFFNFYYSKRYFENHKILFFLFFVFLLMHLPPPSNKQTYHKCEGGIYTVGKKKRKGKHPIVQNKKTKITKIFTTHIYYN